MFLLGRKTDLKFGVNVPSTQHNHQCLFYLMNKVFLHQESVCINDFVVFMCRYVVTLGAPTSIAQRTEDDTLTYLNKGEGKEVYRFSRKRRLFCIKYVKWKRL